MIVDIDSLLGAFDIETETPNTTNDNCIFSKFNLDLLQKESSRDGQQTGFLERREDRTRKFSHTSILSTSTSTDCEYRDSLTESGSIADFASTIIDDLFNMQTVRDYRKRDSSFQYDDSCDFEMLNSLCDLDGPMRKRFCQGVSFIAQSNRCNNNEDSQLEDYDIGEGINIEEDE